MWFLQWFESKGASMLHVLKTWWSTDGLQGSYWTVKVLTVLVD